MVRIDSVGCQHVCSFEGANLYSSLAQSVEHAAVNRSVVGSSPTGGVRFSDLEPRTKISGSMVKRLRHRPFTAVTGVQIPLESLPLRKQLNLVP